MPDILFSGDDDNVNNFKIYDVHILVFDMFVL